MDKITSENTHLGHKLKKFRKSNTLLDTAFILAILTTLSLVIGTFHLAGLLSYFGLETTSFITNTFQVSTATISVASTFTGRYLTEILFGLLICGFISYLLRIVKQKRPKISLLANAFIKEILPIEIFQHFFIKLLIILIVLVLTVQMAYNSGKELATTITKSQKHLYYKISNGIVDTSESFVSIICGSSTCAYWSHKRKVVVIIKSDQEFQVVTQSSSKTSSAN